MFKNNKRFFIFKALEITGFFIALVVICAVFQVTSGALFYGDEPQYLKDASMVWEKVGIIFPSLTLINPGNIYFNGILRGLLPAIYNSIIFAIPHKVAAVSVYQAASLIFSFLSLNFLLSSLDFKKPKALSVVIICASPILFYSKLLYPEVNASSVLALATACLIQCQRNGTTPKRLWVLSLLSVILMLLFVRYSIIVFGLWVALTLMNTEKFFLRSQSDRRFVIQVSIAALITLLSTIGIYLFIGKFIPIYNTFGTPLTSSGSIDIMSFFNNRFLPTLFDKNFGLLPYYPIFIFSLLPMANFKIPEARIITIVVIFYITFTSLITNPPGYEGPARYWVVVLPVIASGFFYVIKKSWNNMDNFIKKGVYATLIVFSLWGLFVNVAFLVDPAHVYSAEGFSGLYTEMSYLGLDLRGFLIPFYQVDAGGLERTWIQHPSLVPVYTALAIIVGMLSIALLKHTLVITASSFIIIAAMITFFAVNYPKNISWGVIECKDITSPNLSGSDGATDLVANIRFQSPVQLIGVSAFNQSRTQLMFASNEKFRSIAWPIAFFDDQYIKVDGDAWVTEVILAFPNQEVLHSVEPEFMTLDIKYRNNVGSIFRDRIKAPISKDICMG